MSLTFVIRARRGALAIATSVVAVTAIGACDGTRLLETGPSVATVISAVSTPTGAPGLFTAGRLPSSATGAVFTVSAPPAAVVGGTALYTLSSSQPFQEALVSIDGYDGYFDVDLPTAVTTVDLLVTFRQEQLFFAYNLAFNGTAVGGTQGASAFAQTRLISVGTGDVQVSIFFDSLADLDLHVFDPANERIFFGNPVAASGGTLDLDANAACGIDNPIVNNENVTFPTGTAPRGTYRVEVNYWSDCGVDRVRYVVTVGVKGQPPRVFVGQFGDVAQRGLTHQIVTFTY